MVQSINFVALRDAEYLQLLSSTILLVERNNPVVLNVQPQVAQLQTTYNLSRSLFKIPRDSPFSKELLVFDTRRNNAIKGIVGIIRSYQRHFNATYREAAGLLHRNLLHYGKKIYLMNYQSKSTIFRSIAKQWENEPSLAAAATLLHLDDWKTELKESNTGFIELYLLRNKEYSAKSVVSFRQSRVEGMKAYKNLIDQLEARAITDATVDYTKVLKEIDASLDQYNTLLNGRKGIRKKTEPNEEPIEDEFANE